MSDGAAARPAAAKPEHSERSEVRRRRLPIDRGWAWVIVAAASGIYGLQNASLKTYGLIYVHMVDHFRSDASLIMWIIAAGGPIACAAGPFTSLVLKRTSHRFVAVVGSVLAATGMAATGYIPRVEVGFLTLSILNGFGMAFLNVSSLTCSLPYFDRHRGLAIGLISASAGVMSFVLPNVIAAVFEAYSFSGAMLIYAGLLLQPTVLGCLLRPPEMYSERRNKHPIQTAMQRLVADELLLDTDRCEQSSAAPKQLSAAPKLPSAAPKQSSAAPTMPSLGEEKSLDAGKGRAEQQLQQTGSGDRSLSAAAEKDDRFDFSLFRSERMWMIGLIGLFAIGSISTVFTVILPYGDSIGLLRSTTAMLIAICGALEIFCRGLQGWFSDLRVMPILVQLGLCTGLTGIGAVLCPIIGGAAGVGLLAALFGAAGTSIYALTTTVMRELLGAEKVTSAIGVQSLFVSLSYILATAATVYTMEAYGSWHYMFYYIGGNLMISSMLCMGYSLVLKAREERQKQGSC